MTSTWNYFFKNDEEANAARNAAKLGDDRAATRLAFAHGRPALFLDWEWHMSGSGAARRIQRPSIAISEPDQHRLYSRQAEEQANFDILPFSRAVGLGLRKPRLQYASQMVANGDYMGFNSGMPQADQTIPPYIKEGRGKIDFGLLPNLRFEGQPAYRFVTLNRDQRPDLPIVESKRIAHYAPSGADILQKMPPSLVREHLRALETCALAGSIEAAELLLKITGQESFRIREAGWFFDAKYESNPHHDVAKARAWRSNVNHLRYGAESSTAREYSKFVDSVMLAQSDMPEGLYNIGMALSQNEPLAKHTGYQSEDYLKHAANLGYGPAARELGERAHHAYETSGDKAHLQDAHYWYGVGADLGHPNAMARFKLVQNIAPDLDKTHAYVQPYRQPSAGHIKRHPASAWEIEIPDIDLSYVKQGSGPIILRLQQATQDIDKVSAAFNDQIALIQAKIDDLIARQGVMDKKIDRLSGEELAAMRNNTEISRKILGQERAKELSRNRWVQEHIGTVASALALSAIFPHAGAGAALGAVITHRAPRTVGDRIASNNAVNFNNLAIRELQDQKVDVTRFENEIRELANMLQKLDESRAVQDIKKNDVKRQHLLQGMLMQRILHSALANCDLLENTSQSYGIQTADELVAAFHDHPRLSKALQDFIYGHANTADLRLILAESSQWRGRNDLLPHQETLYRFVEKTIKSNIKSYFTKASQIDVIETLGLIDFDTMRVTAVTAEGALKDPYNLSPEEKRIREALDSQTRIAMTSMFAREHGVSHIGDSDIRRLFSYYLHLHGGQELYASELRDGMVLDRNAPKLVSPESRDEMERFGRMVKESYHQGRETQPDVGNLFLRVCGYEYFLPQAVRTSGEGNRFADNPEAPVAYGMVNEVIHAFVQRMVKGGLTDGNRDDAITVFKSQVGEALDNIIAQSFIDFFRELGTAHEEPFRNQREKLQAAYLHDTYGPRFDNYQEAITNDAVKKYDLFLEIYARNLQAHMEIATEDKLGRIEKELERVQQLGHSDFVPSKVIRPGTREAVKWAEGEHRFTNMPDGWRSVRTG